MLFALLGEIGRTWTSRVRVGSASVGMSTTVGDGAREEVGDSLEGLMDTLDMVY